MEIGHDVQAINESIVSVGLKKRVASYAYQRREVADERSSDD